MSAARINLRAPRLAALAAAGAACLTVALGCGSGSHTTETQKVEAVVRRWIAAERAGDGRTWCAQLSAARLAKEQLNIYNGTGKHYSCAVMHSTRPPGIARLDLYARARREVTEGFRIERTTIIGYKATVAFSWLVSSQPNPLITYAGDVREGNRWVTSVSLVRDRGRWQIGRS
jgi:hypothetical protein